MHTMNELQKPGRIDILFESAGIIGLVFLILVPLFYYPAMPDQIPTHFGIKGFADGWGPKTTIWLLPVIGFIIYAGLSVLNFFLIRSSPSGKLDPTTEIKQKKGVYTLLQFLKAALSVSFAYIVYASIQVSFANQDGIGQWFLPVFIVVLTVVPIIFVIRLTLK